MADQLSGAASPTAAKLISFRDNVANRHGEVYRSSAIFYLPPTDRVRTTVSFLNYWSLKRELQVTVLASVRAMDGRLVGRERLRFEQGQVLNYRPPVPAGFEGSVEIEVFALENMVIPYAAIVAWYDTDEGVTVVHSYARAYSAHEVEEGRMVTRGREACWTLAGDAGTTGFAVFHNGGLAVAAQDVRLAVVNAAGERRGAVWKLPALRAYESVCVVPAEHIDGLAAFLGGRNGQAELEFELGNGFTRMLVGQRRPDWRDLQVTHSNFNYTQQPTDMAGPGAVGWMEVPQLPVASKDLVVYPQSVQGRYRFTAGALAREFASGEPVEQALDGRCTLKFEACAGELPTRLVTAIRVQADAARIPNECSLGILTALQPPKRLWWGALRCEAGVQSQLVVHDLPEIYGGMPDGATLSMRLFSAQRTGMLETEWPSTQLARLATGVPVDAIWPQAREFLGGEPGYFTLFCGYGGLTAYTLSTNAQGSVCLEHGF